MLNVVYFPQVTLADQQKDRLIELIGFRKSYISKVTGRDLDAGVSLLSKMEQSRACITVMTPQILINGLRESDPKDRIEMGNISMIVLDECHKTQVKLRMNNAHYKFRKDAETQFHN